MQAHEIHVGKQEKPTIISDNVLNAETPRVVLCVDSVVSARTIISPAKAVAKAIDGELSFVHVIETHSDGPPLPFDPVEWDIKRRKAEAYIKKLAEECRFGESEITTRVLEGHCAEQISAALSDRSQDIAVLLRKDDEFSPHISETARCILANGTSSLLLVPTSTKPLVDAGFKRILLPLDGSSQSENALPIALRIAESENAELILVHAQPEPVFTQAGPAEPNDKELLDQIRRRNYRVAKKYLDRLCTRIRANGTKARTVVLHDGDVRRKLAASIEEHSADLLILASHGHSGFGDVPLGDTARFVLCRSSVPVLLVRCGSEPQVEHAFSGTYSKGIRRLGASAQ